MPDSYFYLFILWGLHDGNWQRKTGMVALPHQQKKYESDYWQQHFMSTDLEIITPTYAHKKTLKLTELKSVYWKHLHGPWHYDPGVRR